MTNSLEAGASFLDRVKACLPTVLATGALDSLPVALAR